jgi:hypothetical protein
MRIHIDVLGWLHTLWGIFGVLAGGSLAVIALGAVLSVGEMTDATRGFGPSVVLLVIAGSGLALLGLLMVGIGGALRRRVSGGRHAAIVAAVPTLLLIPFGTALALYTFWTLVNDDARRAFGRPIRTTTSAD